MAAGERVGDATRASHRRPEAARSVASSFAIDARPATQVRWRRHCDQASTPLESVAESSGAGQARSVPAGAARPTRLRAATHGFVQRPAADAQPDRRRAAQRVPSEASAERREQRVESRVSERDAVERRVRDRLDGHTGAYEATAQRGSPSDAADSAMPADGSRHQRRAPTGVVQLGQRAQTRVAPAETCVAEAEATRWSARPIAEDLTAAPVLGSGRWSRAPRRMVR